jgi:hypothetical protein
MINKLKIIKENDMFSPPNYSIKYFIYIMYIKLLLQDKL